MNIKLIKLAEAFDAWCGTRKVPYDIVIDEDDIQGYLVFKRYNHLLPRLIYALAEPIRENQLHIKQHLTRQGIVLAFSLRALSEAQLTGYLGDDNDFTDALEMAFVAPLAEMDEPVKQAISRPVPQSKITPKPGAVTTPPMQRKQPGGPASSPKQEYDVQDKQFGQKLTEALDGYGAEFQPNDIMANVRRAIHALGLQQKLKTAGITAKRSADGLYLHFYAPGPDGQHGLEIKRFFLQDLADPSKLTDGLKELVDIAFGRAPGSGKLEDEVRKREDSNLQAVAKQFAVAAAQKAQGLHAEDFGRSLERVLADGPWSDFELTFDKAGYVNNMKIEFARHQLQEGHDWQYDDKSSVLRLRDGIKLPADLKDWLTTVGKVKRPGVTASILP